MSRTGLTGRCACGRVSFRLNREPMFTHCCHCRQCQRLSGSAFALNTMIENDSIELLSGDIVVTAGPTETGRVHDIYRCSACMTAVWSDYGGRPNYRFVRVGALDDPDAVPAPVHIFARSKLECVVIPGKQRRFDVFYELEKEWPADMLVRRSKAIGG